MAETINIKRVVSLPTVFEASTIYIAKSKTNINHVDLVFVGNSATDIRRAVTIPDVQVIISDVLTTWIPKRSETADKLSKPFQLTLEGDVTGTAEVDGLSNVKLTTRVVNGGGGGGSNYGQKYPSGTVMLDHSFAEGGPVAGMAIQNCILPGAKWSEDSTGVAEQGGLWNPDQSGDVPQCHLMFSVPRSAPQDEQPVINGPFAVMMTFTRFGEDTSNPSKDQLLDVYFGRDFSNWVSLSVNRNLPEKYLQLSGYNFSDVFSSEVNTPITMTCLVYPATQKIELQYTGGNQEGGSSSAMYDKYITRNVSTAPLNWNDLRVSFANGIDIHRMIIVAL